MKRIIAALAIALFATAVYASCRTSTIYTPDGRLLVCTTCCYDREG